MNIIVAESFADKQRKLEAYASVHTDSNVMLIIKDLVEREYPGIKHSLNLNVYSETNVYIETERKVSVYKIRDKGYIFSSFVPVLLKEYNAVKQILLDNITNVMIDKQLEEFKEKVKLF